MIPPPYQVSPLIEHTVWLMTGKLRFGSPHDATVARNSPASTMKPRTIPTPPLRRGRAGAYP